jgi:ferric-dicitrate binding protein FerR (iron transport regulator)
VSGPRYATLARRVLARREDDTALPLPDGRERAASIAAIEQAIASARQRRRFARWATGVTAVAAAAALVVGVGGTRAWTRQASAPGSRQAAAGEVQIVAHPAAGGASVMLSGSQAPLVDGRAVASGSRIVTPSNGSATLSFSTGTSASLGASADLSVEEDGGSQMLRLAAGSVDLHVAKLGPGQRFLVDTADTEVEVRGTRFRVEVVSPSAPCGAGTTTRVAVSEGVVVVRHGGVESRVEAGSAWPAGCAASPPAQGAAAMDGQSSTSGARPVRAVTRRPSSDLADQNDLFAQGTRAWRRGDGAVAVAAFDQLLARYPTSPLVESAMIERMRVLRVTAPERASQSARDYIARYPSGFGVPEAEALLQANPP